MLDATEAELVDVKLKLEDTRTKLVDKTKESRLMEVRNFLLYITLYCIHKLLGPSIPYTRMPSFHYLRNWKS